MKPRLNKAAEAFKAAIEFAPDRLTYQVDYAEYVLAAQGKQGQWSRVLNRVVNAPAVTPDPDQLENTRAIQRARALLDAGLDKRWED